MAEYVARHASRHHPNLRDEFTSALNLALVESAQRFRPAKGGFRPYLLARLRGAALDVLAAERKHRLIAGRRRPSKPPVDWVAERDFIDSLCRRLTPREAATLRLIYLDGYSEAEIAGMLGLSRMTIHRTHKSALARLRVYLEKSR